MGCPANLLVHCPSDALRAQAAEIFFASGGYRLVHFGRWVVEAIEPAGVPDEAPLAPWEREHAREEAVA